MISGGQGERTGHERSDAAMLAKAVKERWPIPDGAREAIVARVLTTGLREEATNREVLRAASCVAAFDRINIEAEKMEKGVQEVNVNVGVSIQDVVEAKNQDEGYREYQRAKRWAKLGGMP